MKVLGLDHIGIAVENIDQAVRLYEKTLGVQADEIFTAGSGAMRGSFISLGGTARLELAQPLSPASPAARFVAEKGYGIAHLALRVADLDEAIADLKAMGLVFLGEKPFTSRSGERVIFVDPKSFGGVTLELIGK